MEVEQNGKFDIHSFYVALRGVLSCHFPLEGYLGCEGPSECFFVWTLAWGKMNTCDNLRRRGHTIVDWFCMCQCSGEGVDHLLIHCTVAY